MATTRAPKTARTYTAAGKAARATAAAARKAAATVTPAVTATPAQATVAMGQAMGPALLALPAPGPHNRPAPAPAPTVAIGVANHGIPFGPYYVATGNATSAPAAPAVGKLPNGLPALVPAAVTAQAASHIAYLRVYAAKNAGTGTGWQHMPTLTDGYVAAVVANCPTQRAARRRMRAWLAPVAAKHGGPQAGTGIVA